MPVGDFTKDKIREMAKELNLVLLQSLTAKKFVL